MSVSSKPSIEMINKEIGRLPMLPGVLFQLMKLDPEDMEFYDTMLQLAKSDPPLAAFILGYSNSAISSPNSQIDSIQTALTRVGSRTIMELLTVLSVSKVFVPTKDEHKKIWAHSIEVASIASFLARLTPGDDFDPETAYFCGLLHDIGRFVLFQLSPNALNETDAKGWGSPEELISAELETVGFTHSKVGYLACKKLEIPSMAANVVRYHHNREIVTHGKAPAELQNLSLVVQVADAISMLLAKHGDWEEWSDENLTEHILSYCVFPEWKNHNLPIKALVSALPIIMKKAANTCESLGL